MRKNFRKSVKNTAGFTLTEVMIGIMILTVAIVTATNLLVGLISTNRNNVMTLQAYYLAQEGIEAVRNIRDTNWLHNDDFKGSMETGNSYGIFLKSEGWKSSVAVSVSDQSGLMAYSPWEINSAGDTDSVRNFDPSFALGINDDFGSHYYSTAALKRDSDVVFYRHIDVLPACGSEISRADSDCENFMLVRAVVDWHDGTKDRELHIDAILSNWKNGAL